MTVRKLRRHLNSMVLPRLQIKLDQCRWVRDPCESDEISPAWYPIAIH